MMEKQECSMVPSDVKIIPEVRSNFDIEQLGRALIAAAINIAEQKESVESVRILASDKGDSMT